MTPERRKLMKAFMGLKQPALVVRACDLQEACDSNYAMAQMYKREAARADERAIAAEAKLKLRDTTIRNLHQCLDASASAIAQYAGVVTHLKLGE